MGLYLFGYFAATLAALLFPIIGWWNLLVPLLAGAVVVSLNGERHG